LAALEFTLDGTLIGNIGEAVRWPEIAYML